MRVYADTSVFGGVFDDEFEESSRKLFDQVRGHRFALVVSSLVEDEIADAPPQVEDFYLRILPLAETLYLTPEALRLRNAYLQAGIVAPKRATDALHVALATVGNCDLIVSWNFRHIVHHDKISRYNAVNTLEGYLAISIHAPIEVVEHEEEV